MATPAPNAAVIARRFTPHNRESVRRGPSSRKYQLWRIRAAMGWNLMKIWRGMDPETVAGANATEGAIAMPSGTAQMRRGA